MSAVESLQAIERCGVIAVIRGLETRAALEAATALYEGGITVLEVTVDTPGAYETIERLASSMQGKAAIGAGTVLDPAAAVAAIQSGAAFLFAPNLNEKVIEVANRHGRLAIPGVMTPTEMVKAAEAGAQAVKLFPANVLGPAFIRQVRAPLPHIPVIPTGGIGPDNAGAFIEAGAIAVGAGGGLLGDDVKTGRLHQVTGRAKALVAAVAAAKKSRKA